MASPSNPLRLADLLRLAGSAYTRRNEKPLGAWPSVRRLTLLLAIVLLISAVGTRVSPAQDSLDIVAVVDDAPISKIDLLVRLQLVLQSMGLKDSPQIRARLAPEVLRSLIDDMLKKTEAQRQGITATKAEVQRALAQIAAANNMSVEQFNKAIEQNPLVEQAFAEEAASQIAWEKLIRNKLAPTVNVTSQDIDEEMRRVKESFDKPQYEVAEIFISADQADQDAAARQSAERLMDQLRQGAEFGRLAQQFSQTPTAAKGGLIGWIRPDQVDQEIADVLLKMKPGEINGPIRSTGGYFILQLRDIRQGGAAKANPDDTIVSLKQIFLPVDSTAPKDKIEEVLRKVNLVRTQVKNCNDMDRIGRDYMPPDSIDLGRSTVGELPEELKPFGRDLPVDQVSPPVQVETGIGIFMICDRQVAQTGMPTRDQVTRSLIALRIDQLARGYLRDLRRAAVIDIRNAAL
jgi:peptidyl-prolyl cis-trans isomerase SurA